MVSQFPIRRCHETFDISGRGRLGIVVVCAGASQKHALRSRLFALVVANDTRDTSTTADACS